MEAHLGTTSWFLFPTHIPAAGTGQQGPLLGGRVVTTTAPLASDTLVQPAKDNS